MIDGQVARVGLLDSSDRELVADLREGNARLLQLPGEEDISDANTGDTARILNQIVRSPIYPRP